MASRSGRSRIWLTVGLFVLLRPSQAKKTICLPEPSETGVSIEEGMDAGNFLNKGSSSDMDDCLNRACDSHDDSRDGNIALLLGKICYSVWCYNPQLCKLKKSTLKSVGAPYRVITPYPEFTNAPKIIEVREDTPAEAHLLRLNATAESRERKTEDMLFEIVAGNIGKTFGLHPKVSPRQVSLRLEKPLDRERIASYHLQIRATNKVEDVYTLLNITINITDINDNPPLLLKSLFIFSVFSNMSVGTTLGRTVATDNDIGKNAKLSYSVTPLTSRSSQVTLDPDSGVLTLDKKLQVDAVKSFHYEITVSDQLHTTKGRLRVDFYPNNVNRPKFVKQSYEVQLNGQVPTGSEVVRIPALDPDFGKLGELTFLITDGNDDDTFRITPEAKEGVMRTAKRIPHRKDSYNLTVDVHDNGYPELYALRPINVVILLQWLWFKRDIYHMLVKEDHSLDEPLLIVSASLWVAGIEVMAGQRQQTTGDKNYYMDDVDQFDLNESSGVMKLRRPLNYESRKVYESELRAEYHSSDSSPKTPLTAKAIFHLRVIDVNDNRPRFSRLYYTQYVSRSSTVNTPVLRINATDADEGKNGEVRLVAVSGNFNDTFSFESDGMVFLRKPLTPTKISTFNITVAAWDGGEPAKLSADFALVSIHVSGSDDSSTSRAPMFDKDSYSAMISEGVPINTEIIQVKASGYQGRSVAYWIRNSKQQMPFQIQPNTGWIRTTERLDRETKDVYVLTIVASTDPTFALVNATIMLQDENDNHPMFTRAYYTTVMTSHHVGAKVIRIQATDKDRGENAKIVYRIPAIQDAKYFDINRKSGLVRTKTRLPKNSLTILNFLVSANDEGRPSLSTVNATKVFALIASTFPISAGLLASTTTEMSLRFTMINVSLEHVSHIGIVVQESDNIVGYEEVTKRPLQSWFYIHNNKGNGVYAQRYLTGRVECTASIRKTKTFDFTVGSDGEKCKEDKEVFCNGKLLADKNYRFQLVAYFLNRTSLGNVTNVESMMTAALQTKVNNSKRTVGFRSWHYDVIVIVLGIIVGLIILATIARAVILYRRDKYRMKKEEDKDGISYPLSNPRYRRPSEPTRSSRSTISFTDLSKSRKNDRKSEKVSPSETEKLHMGHEDREGMSRDSGCGVSVKSSSSDIHHRRTSPVRQAFFSFGNKDRDEDEEEEEASDKEIETELNA